MHIQEKSICNIDTQAGQPGMGLVRTQEGLGIILIKAKWAFPGDVMGYAEIWGFCLARATDGGLAWRKGTISQPHERAPSGSVEMEFVPSLPTFFSGRETPQRQMLT